MTTTTAESIVRSILTLPRETSPVVFFTETSSPAYFSSQPNISAILLQSASSAVKLSRDLAISIASSEEILYTMLSFATAEASSPIITEPLI